MPKSVNLTSEITLPGLFDFVGGAQVGTLAEAPSFGGLTGGNVGQSQLIQTDQTINFKFDWKVSGIFTHAFNPAFLWEIEILMERLGPGEFSLGPVGRKTLTFGTGSTVGTVTTFPGTSAPGSTTVIIPGNTIPAGVYDVVAIVRLAHPGTLQPCFLAAFAEFGKIQFYREH